MKKLVYFVVFAAVITSCRGEKTSPEIMPVADINFKPLVTGDTLLSEKVFGDVVELKGRSIVSDFNFNKREAKMLIKDSFLIIRIRNGNYNFAAFSLPDIKHIKSFGFYKYESSFGLDVRGVDELHPRLVPLWDCEYPAAICNNGILYYLTKDFKMIRRANYFPNRDPRHDYQYIPFSDSLNYYIDKTESGLSVFQMKLLKDSLQIKKLYDLSVSNQIRSWAAYLGYFAANPEKKRLVFAYKNFKRIKFMDSSGRSARNIIFSNELIKERNPIKILAPDNTTHYWGICSGKNYIYALYSGRTPLTVSKEIRNSPGYIFVEQYDWNGNPVRKFKLDHWGFFCVNEAEDKIYLLSVTQKNTFIVYDLPEME